MQFPGIWDTTGLWTDNLAAGMEDAGILGLVCSFVLHGPVRDGQGIKAMSEENLEFCFFGYFVENK